MDTGKRYTIVAGLDFSEPSELALREAIQLASQKNEADLHFVAVVDDAAGSPIGTRDAVLAAAAFRTREKLEATVIARMHDASGDTKSPFQGVIHVRVGSPADEIVRLARDVDADLVLVGTHGRRGFQRWMLGSVAERTLRLAHCPVLVVRRKDYDAPEATAPEPPCPDCVAGRRGTGGTSWWCEEHAKPRERPHSIRFSERFHFPNPIWFGGEAR
jgi:nucleotide-binding universal stress UspA family protein